MPVYKDSDQLYTNLKLLFERINNQDASAVRSVEKSRLSIRLRCTQPTAEVFINGRTKPVQITYGQSMKRPDLDVEMSADALHHILLADLPLGKALSSGQMKVHGPILKSIALQDIFHQGQAFYPQILKEQGMDENAPE